MERFATLEPLRLYSSQAQKPTLTPPKFIGPLPSDLHLLILSYLPVPDFPAYTRSSRAANTLANSDTIWQTRWKALRVEEYGLDVVLDDLDQHAHASKPTVLAVDNDDFGDFVGGSAVSFQNVPAAAGKFKSKFIRAHNLLKPLTKSLSSPPHVILTDLAAAVSPSLRLEALTLRLLSSYLSQVVQPVIQWSVLSANLRSAMDRFDANLLAAFDQADSNSDEQTMRDAAQSSWLVWDRTTDWEMGKVWAEKREIFYADHPDPLKNLTNSGQLDFTPMDEFMSTILDSIQTNGSRAVRVFPPKSFVFIAFADRVAGEVVGEYISSLLARAREVSVSTYLKATAASFKEAWRMVDAIVQIANQEEVRKMAEDVVYRMFQVNMDEYLDEEIDSVKQAFDVICKDWERQSSALAPSLTNADASSPTSAPAPRFLTSHNPAQIKRNVLASFTDILLLPVTIVPRTAASVGATVGATVGKVGGALWSVAGAMGGEAAAGGSAAGKREYQGYQSHAEGMVFEIGDDEDEEKEKEEVFGMIPGKFSNDDSSNLPQITVPPSTTSLTPVPSLKSSQRTPLTSTASTSANSALDQMDLLLSLDVALQLVHASRESLKRVETFVGYGGWKEGSGSGSASAGVSTVVGKGSRSQGAGELFGGGSFSGGGLGVGGGANYGVRVRDTIEEVFVLMLKALGENHVKGGFDRATEQMTAYKPAEHEETTSVAPLLQFFELVHLGDTIQSMVQVYFDKELAPHIDKTDFLNAVVREKKRFENALDDSVAGGLNAGTEVLMNQVEHIIWKETKPREYYPPEDAALELGPTKGCTEAIKCLEMHCKLLKGSTSKEVLEVFHQEVGIRLIAIIQKHLKRQIISLNGGFQVIADLNAYHAFINTLKVPSIAQEFSHLKMLGHVYVVEDAKDLAQIVRDVTRYGGAYRPEDIYEFIQRRSDWKKIEKTVDKTMYNLSFKEDCVVC